MWGPKRDMARSSGIRHRLLPGLLQASAYAGRVTQASRLLRPRALLATVAALAGLQLSAVPAAAAVPGTGCSVFPANNVWNTDISGLPANANSAAWLGNTGGPARRLHPDFGPSGDPNIPYGIPFNVVDPSHAKVSVTFQYASESDRVPYPFGPDITIEGGAGSSGDRHALMIDKGSCELYELYDAHYQSSGSTAGSGAVFNLNGNGLRPSGWTSADAAGLPIFPGLLRLDEVNSGVVKHAIRFTVQRTAASFVWPARHQAGSGPAAVNPPMGARFRMKAGIDVSHYSQKAQVILRAFQHYGLIVADNGSNWYFQGDANNAWPTGLLSELKSIPAGDFEAVDESSLMIDPNSAKARQPGSGAGGGGRVPPPPVKVPGPAAGPVPAPAPAVVAAAANAPDRAAPIAFEDHFAPARTAAQELEAPPPGVAWWWIEADVVVLLGFGIAAVIAYRRRSDVAPCAPLT